MKTTLLIMAAGIGSRFGTGIKQLEPVDDENHIIIGIFWGLTPLRKNKLSKENIKGEQ